MNKYISIIFFLIDLNRFSFATTNLRLFIISEQYYQARHPSEAILISYHIDHLHNQSLQIYF